MYSSDHVVMFLIFVAYAMMGACLGSFSGAISYRIAHQKSWIVDHKANSARSQPARSSCPSCLHQLSLWDLVPILSWVFLKGRCRYCKAPISVRYPVIEICGVVAMGLFYLSGAGGVSLILFVVTLPFSLAGFLLFLEKKKIPFYIYGALFLSISVFFYAVVAENQIRWLI